MRSLPGEYAITLRIRKYANTSPIPAQTSANEIPKSKSDVTNKGRIIIKKGISGRPTALSQPATQLFSHPGQNRFLSMKSIFSLVEDRPGMIFQGLFRNLFPTVRRQTMQHKNIGRRPPHQLFVDLKRGKVLDA